MVTKQELLEITNKVIQKVHQDINLLQADALRFSVDGDLENLRQTLKRQHEAIAAGIAMVDAARLLEER